MTELLFGEAAEASSGCCLGCCFPAWLLRTYSASELSSVGPNSAAQSHSCRATAYSQNAGVDAAVGDEGEGESAAVEEVEDEGEGESEEAAEAAAGAGAGVGVEAAVEEAVKEEVEEEDVAEEVGAHARGGAYSTGGAARILFLGKSGVAAQSVTFRRAY